MNSKEKLKEILADDALLLVYEEYLVSRYAWENLGFYLDVEVYRTVEDEGERCQLARIIFDTYLDPDSQFQLGDVDPMMRDAIHSTLEDPPHNVYDVLQHYSFQSLAHSTVQEFLTGPYYRTYTGGSPPTRQAACLPALRARC